MDILKEDSAYLMDKIVIRDLRANAVIGTLEHERTRPQELCVTLEMELDLAAAGASDDLAKSVDYSEVERRALELIECSRFRLVEALCSALGKLLLEYAPVRRARVTVVKGRALSRSQVEVSMDFGRAEERGDA